MIYSIPLVAKIFMYEGLCIGGIGTILGVLLGLGLSFSQVILEDHNGFIEFDSKENEYARFSIYLPIFSNKSKDQDNSEDTEKIVF